MLSFDVGPHFIANLSKQYYNSQMQILKASGAMCFAPQVLDVFTNVGWF
jgi:hypothetical protein